MARTWPALLKATEECNELGVELMKLKAFPNGKHPGRRRSVILSAEDEIADVIGVLNYLIDKERLDRKRIERRAKSKYRKFSGWWGIPQLLKPKTKPKAKQAKKKATL